jgi:hypothetical protein
VIRRALLPGAPPLRAIALGWAAVSHVTVKSIITNAARFDEAGVNQLGNPENVG